MNTLRIRFDFGKEVEVGEVGQETVTEFRSHNEEPVITSVIDVNNYDTADIIFVCRHIRSELENKIETINHIRESICVDLDEDRVIDLINDNTRSDREICEVVEEGLVVRSSLEY